MKILAMDIGFGTQDILLFDTERRNLENMVKMVVDSPTTRFAKQIISLAKKYDKIFIHGYIIGGGPIVRAIKKVISQGKQVIMTEKAAKTIKDDLSVAKRIGVEVIKDYEKDDFLSKKDYAKIEIKEIDARRLKQAFSAFDIRLEDIDAIAVAVQDHGVPQEEGPQRVFRFKVYKKMIDAGGFAQNFAYTFDEIPSYFHRMLSVRENIKHEFGNIKGIVMDTSPATLFGIHYDEYISFPDVYIGVNVGNGHTLAGIFKEKRLIAIFEDHTVNINTERLDVLLSKFSVGKLTFDEIFAGGGHGVYYREEIKEKVNAFFGIGPNRHILKNSRHNFIFPAPMGDVMMAGPLTLVNVTRNIFAL